ncbi:MAG: hypothetical protein DMG68_03330 [Acidobacteria bacterium]|nr:MAG: hypothetical protein DMG68_03330 [Acidobacteriota bacterium]
MRQPRQGFQAPKRCKACCENEGYANKTSAHVIFAPTLEHGNQSNCEKQDGDDSQCSKPHATPLKKASHWLGFAGRIVITASGDSERWLGNKSEAAVVQ